MSHRLVPFCAAFVATACFSHAASAVTLYNPALGTAPTGQGWVAMTNGGATASGVSAGTWRLDTTADAATSAGVARLLPALDTAGGFNLSFDLQLLGETHLTPDRAGFSVIVTGSNPAEAIELAFWSDRVWAYAFDAATMTFSHSAEALFDTATAAHTYSLTVQNQRFSLASGADSLLAGNLFDYTARGAPYTQGNLVFFGDDTSRAASSVAIGAIVLSPVPEPATAGLFLLGGAVLAVRRRRGRG